MPSLAILSRFGRAAGHHAAVVGADVPHADVIAHDEDDVRLLVLRVGDGTDDASPKASAMTCLIGFIGCVCIVCFTSRRMEEGRRRLGGARV